MIIVSAKVRVYAFFASKAFCVLFFLFYKRRLVFGHRCLLSFLLSRPQICPLGLFLCIFSSLFTFLSLFLSPLSFPPTFSELFPLCHRPSVCICISTNISYFVFARISYIPFPCLFILSFLIEFIDFYHED